MQLPEELLAFGPFVLNLSMRTLNYREKPVSIGPREFDLLAVLARAPAQLVSKDEVMRVLWPHQDATEAALSQTVYRLRRALHAFDPHKPYIVTVPGRGYQFVQPVHSERSAQSADVTAAAFRHYRRAANSGLSSSRSSLLAGIEMYELALGEEPAYAEALAGLAGAYTRAAQLFFLEPRAAFARARNLAKRVLAINPLSAEAYATLSQVALLCNRNRHAASEFAHNAWTISPESLQTRTAMVWEALARESYDASLHIAARLVRSVPSYIDGTALLGASFYYAGSFDDAWTHLQDALDCDPANAYALNYGARALCAAGRQDEACELLKKFRHLHDGPLLRGLHAYLAAQTLPADGRFQLEAERTTHTFAALRNVGIQTFDVALRHLRLGIQDVDPDLIFVPVDPLFAPLRAAAGAGIVFNALQRPRQER